MSAGARLVVLSLLLSACVSESEEAERGPLATAFASASRELEVPERVLLAIGWVETNWRTPPLTEPDPDHVATGARGLMGVIERPDLPRLSMAADHLRVDAALAESDEATNIRAAALVLRELALETNGRVPAKIADWRPAIARYGSPDDELAGESYADHVFEVLVRGADATLDGEALVLPPSGKIFGQTRRALAGPVDFPGADWIPARQGHFVYGRYGYRITHVIIHTTEGSYDGAISWFRSPNNPYFTSAHYVVRSSDGAVTQMVRESDSAHHIGGWNPWTIGIEHEAVAAQGYNWFTEAMLRSSAAITRAACLNYGIPMDRAHILGHIEVPGANHVDPGPHFPWDYYLDLVRDPNTTGGGISNECGSLDYFGECQGSLLRWCEGGAVRSFDCAVQGETCGYQDDQIGFNCVQQPEVNDCDALGYAGECQGSTLRWCETGAIRTADCAAEQKACTYQNAEIGFNCLYTCGSLGYLGTCEGDLLRWCENGSMRQQSCGALGQSCGYQDDAIGFNCL